MEKREEKILIVSLSSVKIGCNKPQTTKTRVDGQPFVIEYVLVQVRRYNVRL